MARSAPAAANASSASRLGGANKMDTGADLAPAKDRSGALEIFA
jgi:hypothetical protein